MVNECDGERTVVGWYCDTDRVERQNEDEPSDLAAVSPDRQVDFIRWSRRSAVAIVVSNRDDAVPEAGKHGSKRRAFESCPACAEQAHDFAFNDVDESSCRAAAGSQFSNSANLFDLAAACTRQLAAVPCSGDEFADDKPHDEENDSGFDVIAAVDGERVVGVCEEEVEAQRGNDR